MSLSFNSFLSSCIFCSYSLFNLLSNMPVSFNSFSISCIFYLCLRSNISNSFLYSASSVFLLFNYFFISCFSLFNSLINLFNLLISFCFSALFSSQSLKYSSFFLVLFLVFLFLDYVFY